MLSAIVINQKQKTIRDSCSRRRRSGSLVICGSCGFVDMTFGPVVELAH